MSAPSIVKVDLAGHAYDIAIGPGLVDKVKALAQDKGCTPAQLALAWVLAQGEHIVPIPGTRRVRNLDENLGALEVRLTPADLAAIAAVFPVGVTAGLRYPEGMMRLVRG